MVIELQEEADAAFAEANRLASTYVEQPERSNMLGQLRHARLEAALRRVAERNGLEVGSPHTNPKGGRYSVARGDGIILIRGNVQAHRGPPRASKFRKQMAETNRWLSPTQPDFYMPHSMPRDDEICAVLVVAANKKGDPSIPGWVGIGFPNHDLGSWADIMSLNEMLALYHDADVGQGAAREAVVEIKDQAVPKLKKGNRGE
ncbi:hypothetical protein [Sphingomonas sp. Leaf4]|uniref:hypothetical protein n=1 Tax=Sphingomonas sp. Leaf4 TaxID=2876553 RepID=UPI001E3C062E|nr:hypothetical protein [Sphingomonas sp. Leaf4]